MFPIGIEIELSASYVDSDIEDLIYTRDFILERDFRPRRDRKKHDDSL